MPYDLFSPLSQKVSIHIHETWEPSCGQNHELFFWLLPQIWCSQSSFYPWSIHWEKFQSIKKRKPTKNPTLDSFLGLCGGWPLHLTPLGHYLMLSTSLFQGLGIAWQLPITSSFFPPYSSSLFAVLHRLLLFCSDLSRFSSAGCPSSCALNNVIDINSMFIASLSSELEKYVIQRACVCLILMVRWSWRKGFMFPWGLHFVVFVQPPREILFPHRQLLAF